MTTSNKPMNKTASSKTDQASASASASAAAALMIKINMHHLKIENKRGFCNMHQSY